MKTPTFLKPLYALLKDSFLNLLGHSMMFLAAVLPFRVLLFLGQHLLSPILWHSAKRSHRVARHNLNLCFPYLPTHTLEQLHEAYFKELSMGLLTTAAACSRPSFLLHSLTHLHDMRHLLDAYHTGRGVILLSAHFTHLELAGRLLAEKIPLTITYKPQKNKLLDRWLLEARQQHYCSVIPHDDPKRIIKALRSGAIVFFACDVDVGPEKGLEVPFFGQMAYTTPAVHYYALWSGALVVPGFFYRRLDGKGLDLVVHPPLLNFPSSQPQADTTRINQIIEEAVKRQPDQYLWSYARFKYTLNPSFSHSERHEHVS